MKQTLSLLAFLLLMQVTLAAQNDNNGQSQQDTAVSNTTRKVYSMYNSTRPPSFPGGEQELNHFMRSHFKYYYQGNAHLKATTIAVNFVVEKDGSITNISLLHGEAFILPAVMDMLEEMPPWEPGEFQKEPVAVLFTLPIRVEY